ncbi:hypothetical protein H480_29011, partial [Amycolatopsis vancoresmycina DSM 44592]
WRAGRSRPGIGPLPEPRNPTPVPDGPWHDARTDLLRLRLGPDGEAALARRGPAVPGATRADIDWVAGRTDDAVAGYRLLLSEEPDDPCALVGLGLALAARSTGPASRALLHRPELVRAVHRLLREDNGTAPPVESVAGWIGRFTN